MCVKEVDSPPESGGESVPVTGSENRPHSPHLMEVYARSTSELNAFVTKLTFGEDTLAS